MSTGSSEIVKFLLAQLAAESYLDGSTVAGIPVYEIEAERRERLKLGSNNYKTLERGQTSETPSLPGHTRMTDAQVDEFTSRYEVKDHLSNTMTGFSATLLWDKLDNRFVLSFRSTEYPNEDKGGDWRRDGLNGANGEIGAYGFAYAQIADMEAYYQRIVKPLITDPITRVIRNFAVTGYSLGGHLATVFAEAHHMDPGFLQAYTFNAPGRGGFSGDTIALVNRAYQALSAPGVDALLRSGTSGESIYNADNFYTAANGIRATLHAAAGLPTGVNIVGSGTSQALAGGKIVQVFGKADTDDSLWVANAGVHSSNKVELFIEDQPNVQGLGPIATLDSLTGVRSDFGTTHSITLIADTLAVMTALQKLAPALTPEAMIKIFSAGSNERGIGFLGQKGQAESNSLETVVESLAGIFGVDIAALIASKNGNRDDGKLPRDDAGGGFGNLLFRNIFYDSLKEIGNKAGAAGNYMIEALAGKPVADVVAAAEGVDARGTAYLYALKAGNPFALIGVNYQERHNINGELNLYNPAERTGVLTKEWIKDRADYLERINYFNEKNARYDLTKASENPNTLGDTTATQYDSEDIVWDDRGAKVLVRRRTEPETMVYRLFGTDAADALTGGKNADRLYGGGSTDYLIGKDGADYLEGGTGLDIYEYSSARQGLFGTTTDGHDSILDVDGKGVLRYQYNDANGDQQSTVIGGVALKGDDGKWRTADGRFVFETMGADLKVTFASGLDGSITIKNYKDGDLSIRLQETRVDPQTGAVIAGDYERNPSPITRDPFGNLTISGPEVLDQEDILFGGRPDAGMPVVPNAPGEKILSGGGNDRVYSDRPNGVADNGLGNADWIIAGAGRDFIDAGAGNDRIDAGADGVYQGNEGGDIVDAGPGDDEVYGDTKVALSAAIQSGNTDVSLDVRGDWLIGGEGADWLVGGRANDLILGGAGKDVIIGGAGNDDIYGDHNVVAQAYDWGVIREVISGLGDDVYQRTIVGAGSADFGLGAADVIYAGAGNDWIDGGAGDDFIDAGPGNDVSFGGAGADVLIGGAGNDVLIGDGTDVPSDEQGGDYLDGGAGNDYLDGGNGDDVLIGGVEDDILRGGAGNDILIGGPGIDQLEGGAGKDTYVFNRGDGIETVIDIDTQAKSPDASVLVLGDGIKASDIKFRKGSLLVDLGPADSADPNSAHDMIHFEGFDPFDPKSTEILGEIRFADGASMSYGDILEQGFDIDGTEENDNGHDDDHPILVGTAVTDRIHGFGGNDMLLGAGGDDVLDGGSGNDHLQGGEGNDVLLGDSGDYVLDGGAGTDTLAGGAGNDTYIADFSDTIIDTEGSNAIQFADDVTPDRLIAHRVTIQGERYVALSRTDDPNAIPGLIEGLRIKGDVGEQNFSFTFADGTTMTQQQLYNTALTEDLALHGTDGADTLTGYGGNDTIDAASGDDVLNGGAGADVLIGREGSDVYRFAASGGRDTVIDAGDIGAVDAVLFSLEITADAVTFVRQANGDLRIVLDDADQVTISGQYNNPANRIEEIRFGDGSIVTVAELDALPVAPIVGTPGDDVLTGTIYDETLIGLEGADTYVFGYGMGRDTLIDSGGRILLQAGVGFDALRAARVGDDLSLSIRGADQGVLLKDYYLGSQDWAIEDGTGAQSSPGAILQASEAASLDWLGNLRADYRYTVRADLYAKYLYPGSRYDVSGDGILHTPWQETTSVNDISAYASLVNQTNTTTYSFFNGGTSTTTDKISIGQWTSPYPSLLDSTITIRQAMTTSDDDFIFGEPATTQNSTNEAVTANVGWQRKDLGVGSISAMNSGFVMGTNPVTGQPEAIGTYQTTVVSDSFTGTVAGRIAAIQPGSIAAGSEPYPSRINANLTIQNINEYITEVIAGPGDNKIANAMLVDAGDGNDVVMNAGLAYGGEGDDAIYSTGIAIGGTGNDYVHDARRTVVLPEDTGHDTIYNQSGPGEYAHIDWYYNSIGMPDWQQVLRDPVTEEPRSIEEVIALGLLPALPLPITANDWNALAPLYASGRIEKDALEFGPGVSADNLTFSWGQTTLTPQYGGEQPYVTLDVGITPDNVVSVVIPHSDDLLGAGIEEFRFADGTVMSISQIIALAPPAPSFDPQLEPRFELGWGYNEFYAEQIRALNQLQFGQSIAPGDISATRADNDLLLSHANGDQIRLVDWYADPANMPALEITFYDGSVWSADYLTAEGITPHGTAGDDYLGGTPGNDVMFGLNGSDNLSGDAGNDTLNGGAGDDYLDGGAGDDTYVFRLGSGIDTITDASGTDTLVFGADITPDMLTLGLGSLMINVGTGGDAIHIEGFDPGDVYGSQVIENFTFADNTSLTYEALIARGIHIYGSDGDDEVSGTNGPDIIDGGTGNDYLFGDAGDDTYIFGRGYGRDMFAEYDETAGNIDTVRFAADIAPGDVTVSGENGDLILSINDTDDQVVLQYWFWNDESKIERVAFADDTVWDIAALEAMVPMADATEFDDLIFGASGDDVIDGLGGNDQILGGHGNDILRGGEGDDYLNSGRGDDILLGGEGADDLEDWSGSNYFDGGNGDDTVLVNGGTGFVIGGRGNDSIENFASGNIVVAFNAGDGQDTIYAGAPLTLSLGGGIHAADLSLRRDGTDLVLETGAADSIRLTPESVQNPEAWPQLKLQLIDGAASIYDLNEIINIYNYLQSNDPGLSSWQFGDTLASVLPDTSTTSALGGDLAYHYASTGSNDGLAPEFIRNIISDPAFGVALQPFEPALTGTTGDDVLTGSNGPDTLIGGAGDDMLDGGAGNDTYVLDAGSGVDVIQDSAGIDTVAFGADITPDMLTLGLGSLLIRVGDGGDAIHIEGFDPSNVYGSQVIENFAFANGIALTYTDLLARGFDLADTDGVDVITGTNVADRINGLGGNDHLSGGEGDDTYVYQAGDGLDTIADESGTDAAAFGAGLTRDNVVARMSGDNTTARVRVLDAYGNAQTDQGLDIALDAGGSSPVEWFTFTAGAPATLDDLLIRQEIHYGTRRNDVIRTGRNDDLIYADRGNDVVYAGTGNDVIFGDRGRDILYGEAGNDVLIGGRGKDQLYGGFGDDVLEGGRGSDILDGGAGFNTHVFERNFGDDRIVRGGGSGALRFGDGISARDLSFKRRNNDLVVKVKGEGRVRIEGWFDKNAMHQVEFAEFADGTVLGADKFVTSGNDTERERDEDDDDDVSHYGNDDNGSKPHGASKNDDRDEIRPAKSASGQGKHSETSDSAWFDKVAEKWNGHYARTTQQNAERDDARSGASHGTQPFNRWQRMHDKLSAHLADGHGDADNGGADMASFKPGSAHGASFAQFGTIGYGGLGVKDRGAADLRPFAGLKEGLARIA